MNKWQVLAQAFENLGNRLWVECESTYLLSKNCPEFDELYTNYAQLLNSINAQIATIEERFNAIRESG